jgi:hypothetical protein
LEITADGSNQRLIGEFCYKNFGECNGDQGVAMLEEANRSVLGFFEDRCDGAGDYIKIKGGRKSGSREGLGDSESASSVDSLEAKKCVGGGTTEAGGKRGGDWMKFSKGFTIKAPKMNPSENLSFNNKVTPRNQEGATDSPDNINVSSTVKGSERKTHFSPQNLNFNAEQNSRAGFIPLAATYKTPELKFVTEKSDESFMALDKKSQVRNSKSNQDITPATPDSKGSPYNKQFKSSLKLASLCPPPYPKLSNTCRSIYSNKADSIVRMSPEVKIHNPSPKNSVPEIVTTLNPDSGPVPKIQNVYCNVRCITASIDSGSNSGRNNDSSPGDPKLLISTNSKRFNAKVKLAVPRGNTAVTTLEKLDTFRDSVVEGRQSKPPLFSSKDIGDFLSLEKNDPKRKKILRKVLRGGAPGNNVRIVLNNQYVRNPSKR